MNRGPISPQMFVKLPGADPGEQSKGGDGTAEDSEVPL